MKEPATIEVPGPKPTRRGYLAFDELTRVAAYFDANRAVFGRRPLEGARAEALLTMFRNIQSTGFDVDPDELTDAELMLALSPPELEPWRELAASLARRIA